MHEFGIVNGILSSLKPQLAAQHVTRVTEIHFRRGSAFSEDALRQAYESLSAGTVLEGAKLVIDTVNLNYECDTCGYKQVITSDDLIGHMFVCPDCGRMIEVDEAHDLELIDVIAEQAEVTPNATS
jgi:Zn finger protein HypA/HybF involved in hydrogenase expression